MSERHLVAGTQQGLAHQRPQTTKETQSKMKTNSNASGLYP